MPILAGRCDSLQNTFNGPGQTPTLPTDESQTPILGSEGAECGALSRVPAEDNLQIPSDPRFVQLLDLWDTLPEHIKLSIHALSTSAILGDLS